MHFDLSVYEGFRQEIADWCLARWPGGFAPFLRSRSAPGFTELSRSSQRALGEQGWLCGGWPVEYGGGGWSKLRQAVFNEEIAYRRVPLSGLAVSTVGPTLMVYGSEEQKAKYIARTAKGELFWSQGFSEPNAGSDLASLQTAAVADGDEFIINGAKLWGDHRHADYALLLARTDPGAPKHRGISQFILPLHDTPGITVEPVKDFAAQDRWTLMTMVDVRVPRDAVVGELNRGWYQSTTTLDLERSQISWAGNARRTLENMIRFARLKQRGGQAAIDDPFVRDRLGELAVEVEMARWLSFRVAFLQDQGGIPNMEASVSKLWATETLQRLQRASLNLAGTIARSAGGEAGEFEAIFEEEYWIAAGWTIAGGASEIQRNIIATRGFGLPR